MVGTTVLGECVTHSYPKIKKETNILIGKKEKRLPEYIKFYHATFFFLNCT